MSVRFWILPLLTVILIISMREAVLADACPASVASLSLEGKGTSGHVFRYRAILSSTVDGAPSGLGLQIRIKAGAPIHVVISQFQPKQELNSGDVKIFERPAQDVLSAAVVDTETANGVIPCSSGTANVGDAKLGPQGWRIPTVVATLDDSNRDTPDPLRADMRSGESETSSFKTRSPLEYPDAARDNNVVGQTRTEVRIGPTGQIEDSHIISSSGSKLLDDAALKAATASTYSGSTFDGIPVTVEYGEVFQFAIDDGNHGVSPAVVPWEILGKSCPALVDSVTLVSSLSAGTVFWYDLALDTTTSPVDAINLAVVGAHSPVEIIHWSTVLSGIDSGWLSSETASGARAPEAAFARNSEPQTYSAVPGVLFWPGDPLAAATVQDATPRSKSAVKCSPIGARVAYDVDKSLIVAEAETDRPWLSAPVLESVLPARFANIAWPKYVPSSDDPATAVAVSVRVHVTQAGVPLVALLSNAPIAPGFAAAALASAMASTYIVPLSQGGVPVTQTFDAEYVYEPAN